MFLVRSSIRNSNKLITSTGYCLNNTSTIIGNRSFSTGEETDKKSIKKQKKEELIKQQQIEEENKVYGASSLSLITVAKVEGKKENQKRLLKIKSPKEERELELNRQYPIIQLDEDKKQFTISKQELKQQIDENKIDNTNVFIIDLRSPKEFYADHPIKQSQNIPMEYPKIIREVSAHSQKRGKKTKVVEKKKTYDADSELNFWQKALKLTPLQWKEKYGFNKVKTTDHIIFYSANNGRGIQATEMAIKSGFVNSKFLEGGIRNWNKFYSSD